MAWNDRTADRKTDAAAVSPAAARVSAVETLKNLWKVAWVNACTGVSDGYAGTTVFRGGFDGDRAAVGSVFDGVGKQV